MTAYYRDKVEISVDDLRKIMSLALYYFYKEKDDDKRAYYAGIMKICTTGCRPREAIITVFNKRIEPTKVFLHIGKKSTVGAANYPHETKTKMQYYWYLDPDYDKIWNAIRSLNIPGVAAHSEDHKKKQAKLSTIYHNMIDSLGIEKKFTMRSIRCYHATRYVALNVAAKQCTNNLVVRMPPNPLQHESLSTTKKHYSQKEAFNRIKGVELAQRMGLNNTVFDPNKVEFPCIFQTIEDFSAKKVSRKVEPYKGNLRELKYEQKEANEDVGVDSETENEDENEGGDG